MAFHQPIFMSLKRSKKSAVIFFAIFVLLGCEPKESQNVVVPPVSNEHPAEPKPSEVIESNPKLLKRGVYTDFKWNIADITEHEQTPLLQDLLEGLVIYDTQGNVIPAAAEKWQTTDNKIWTFTLRRDLQWSNGEPLLAQDFVRSWQALILSDSPLKQYFAYLNLNNAEAVLAQKLPVEQLGIRAIDNYNLQLSLDKATPYLPQMLVHSALLPQHKKDETFIGNGAYKILEVSPEQVKLEKNPFYRNKDEVSFEEVLYQKIQPNQLPDQFDWIEKPLHQNDKTQYFPQLCTYFYEFNFNDPLLKQSAVRTALVSMISPRGIIPEDKTLAPNSVNFMPQNMQFEQEREWKPTLVEQLLQQTGVTEKNPLVLRMSYDNAGIHPIVAEQLIRAWTQSDLIRIQQEPLPYKDLLEKRAKGDFQLIRSGWCADYNEPTAFLSLLHSKSPDNKSGFANEKLDELLEQTLSIKISEQERTALYHQIIELVQREKIVLPLFQYMKPIYIHDSIEGHNLKNPTETVYSKDLYRKSKETKSVDTAQ